MLIFRYFYLNKEKNVIRQGSKSQPFVLSINRPTTPSLTTRSEWTLGRIVLQLTDAGKPRSCSYAYRRRTDQPLEGLLTCRFSSSFSSPFCRMTLQATTLRTDSTFAFTRLWPPWGLTLSLELCSCSSGRTGNCTFEKPSCFPPWHCKELFIFYFVSCSLYFDDSTMILQVVWSVPSKYFSYFSKLLKLESVLNLNLFTLYFLSSLSR